MEPNPYIILHNFEEFGYIFMAISMFLGVGLLMGGIFSLKRWGETRTFMSQQMTLAGPMMKIVAGCMFLLLPTIIKTFMNAFWGTASPISITSTSGGWSQYVPDVIMLVRIVGVGAIMRSIMLFSRMGTQGSQPGTMGRAVVHLIGGLMCVHVVGTADLVRSILNLPALA